MDDLQTLGERYGFSITPVESNSRIKNLQKIDLLTEQKIQFNSLVKLGIASTALSALDTDLYTVSFPEGLPHTLAQLKQGGYGGMIQDPETKRFVGAASFNQVQTHAVLLGAFAVMSIVTTQYYLHEITSNLKGINQKLDKVLEFLYGDKKAELLSEISFIRYAYQNFSSIMTHEQQRIATIASLQSAKKVAIKDIEFYLYDLYKSIQRNDDIEKVSDNAFRMNDSITLSMQLYAVSSLLEIYYSGNMDDSFIAFVEDELYTYMERCDKLLIANFNILRSKLFEDQPFQFPLAKTIDKKSIAKRIDEILNEKQNERVIDKQKRLTASIQQLKAPAKYFVSREGDLYMTTKAS